MSVIWYVLYGFYISADSQTAFSEDTILSVSTTTLR